MLNLRKMISLTFSKQKFVLHESVLISAPLLFDSAGSKRSRTSTKSAYTCHVNLDRLHMDAIGLCAILLQHELRLTQADALSVPIGKAIVLSAVESRKS